MTERPDRTTAAMQAVIDAPHLVDGLIEFGRLTRRMNDMTVGLLLHTAQACRARRREDSGLCFACPQPSRTRKGLCIKCARRFNRKAAG